MEELLAGLRAIAETTRLRLLFVLAHGEFNVSELTQILGQSQPRVSRHLKLMAEAGLLSRYKEGSWVLFRLSEQTRGAALARAVVDLLPGADSILVSDIARMEEIRRQRAENAAAYFVTIHQVLHYLDDPGRALTEAARILKPGGRLLIVDFAPHDLEHLREQHAHRRLGVASDIMASWLKRADLRLIEEKTLPPPRSNGSSGLTVSLWLAQRPATDIARIGR